MKVVRIGKFFATCTEVGIAVLIGLVEPRLVSANDSPATQHDANRIVILQPDGKPAVKAKAVVGVVYTMTTIVNGQDFVTDPNFQHKALQFTSGDDGTISVPPQIDHCAIVVLHDSGFAQVYRDKEHQTDQIQLQAWGKIQGRLMIGNKPGAGEKIRVLPIDLNRPQVGILQDISAVCDADGKFVIPRVPTGKVILARELPAIGSVAPGRFAIRKDLQITPGQTVDVQLGGSGRRVLVKVILPEELLQRKDLRWDHAEATTKFQRLPDPTPNDVKNQPREVRENWFQGYLKTDAGQAWRAAVDKLNAGWKCYDAELMPDGRFVIEDMEAGTYSMYFDIEEVKTHWVGEEKLGPLAAGHIEFTVSEMPGGRSDQPLDIGSVSMEIQHYVTVGIIAPDFTSKTLNGRQIKLSDFRGKYVLLDFWATSCGPCVEETPNLMAVYDTFGKDGRFAMIGISQDELAIDASSYVTKEGLRWTQIFEARDGWQPIARAYRVDALPSIWLVDPAGEVLAKDLRGEAIKAAVADAMKK